jgi:Flp pilus assembly protein protease CpaA
MDWLHAAALALFVAVVAALDLRTRRIPNRIVFSFALVALGFAGAADGIQGLCWAAAGSVVGLALLLLPFATRNVGGGDAKVLAALGCFLGPRLVVSAFLCGSAFGGLAAQPLLWHARARNRPFRSTRATEAALGHPPSLAYAVPLGTGAVFALTLDWIGLSPL